MITYYELLGVAFDAPQSSIKAAFRKNIKIYHPDVNRAENADWITRALTQACTTLSDAAQRAQYDSAIARLEDLNNPAAPPERQPESPVNPRAEGRRATEERRSEHARRAEAARTAQCEKRAARDKAREDAQREYLAWKRLVWEAEQLKEQQRKESAKREAEADRLERDRRFWAEQQRKDEARRRKNQLRTGGKIRHYHSGDLTLFGTIFQIVHVFQADLRNPQTRRVCSEPMSLAVDANGFYIFVDCGRDVVTRSESVRELKAFAQATPELSKLLIGKTPLY
jgi:curved DNA-binding protein CbpA